MQRAPGLITTMDRSDELCSPPFLGIWVTQESGMSSMLDKEDMSCRQCCRSVTFWYGSRSGDLYLRQTDPDPAVFHSDLQDDN